MNIVKCLIVDDAPYAIEVLKNYVDRIPSLKLVATHEPAKEILQPMQDLFLYLRVDRKMIKIMVADIIFVESLKDYVKIILNNKQIVTKHNITALEAMLPEDQFLRVHRSYIINNEKVEAITQSHLQIGNKEIPVGPTYKHNLQQKIKWTEN